MPSFWNIRVLNGPVPALVWPIDLALSIACLTASGVPMSGFGAPALTATPLQTAISARRWLQAALADQRHVRRRAHEFHHRSRHVLFLRDGEHAHSEMVV